MVPKSLLFLSIAPDGLDTLRRHWGWLLVLGVLLLTVGMAAIAYPVAATFTTVEVFGYLLLTAGVIQLASGLLAGRWSGFLQHVVCGLLYLFIGVALIDRPGLGAAGYTLLLAVFFVASGVFRLVFALRHRFAGWGWVAFSGAISLVLGLMIWRDFPASALWVIGTFIGIELIFAGWSWMMLALAAKSFPAGDAMAAGQHS